MRSLQDNLLFFGVHLYILMESLRQKTVQGLIALLSLGMTKTAYADEDIAGIVNNITSGISSVKPGLMMAAQVAGVGCVISGIFLWLRKKNEPHIKGSHIVMFIGIGCILIALDQFISRGQKQAGLRPVSLN